MNSQDFEDFFSACRKESDLFHENPSSTLIKSIYNDPITQETGASPVEPNVPLMEELCDTKEKFRCRTIVFTCYDKEAVDDPEAWLRLFQKNECDWVLGQLEKCPTTERIHIQGMAYSKNPMAWACLKGKSTWKRQCISPEASIVYCSKSKTQLQGPWEFGTRPKFGQTEKSKAGNEKKAAQAQLILDSRVEDLIKSGDVSWKDYEKAKKFKQAFMANEKAHQQRGNPIDHGMPHEWIWGPTGTGKTTMARTQNPNHYLKDKNKWWDDYFGQDAVIIEDLGKKDAEWIGDRLKIWADKWPFKAEFKNGTMDAIRPNKIVVTSNYHIRQLWEDPMVYEPLERRFNIINKQ